MTGVALLCASALPFACRNTSHQPAVPWVLPDAGGSGEPGGAATGEGGATSGKRGAVSGKGGTAS
ncbi:MAG TPA: hypothetical protein VGK73_30240, partial [Polyangiaceae bacterium]